MLKRLCCLLLCLCLFPLTALGEHTWLIADSDTRTLTRDELWGWDYESLGYVLNEIFARHGYVFIAGGRYDNYFKCMPWYTPNANPNNSVACYSQLNSVEWANESLVKQVRQEMRDLHTTNPDGRSLWDTFSPGFDTLQGFTFLTIGTNQTLPVYSAPDANSWRGANGKACVSTTGNVFAAGWESGWLLVMYETNKGGVRVGYVPGDTIKGNVSNNTYLTFDYLPATVLSNCQLTDDPARQYATITSLNQGTTVTYLTSYFNSNAWAYVEATVDGMRTRGFVPANCLNVTGDMDTDEMK